MNRLRLLLVAPLFALLCASTQSQQPGTKRWEYNVGSRSSPPTLGTNGMVYVGLDGSGVLALSASTGARKWGVIFSQVWGAPTVGPDGTVYVAATGGGMLAFDGETGVKKWEVALRGTITATPALGNNGLLYIGTDGGRLYAVEAATGAVRWEYATRVWIQGSAAVGADGTVFVGDRNGKVHALVGETGTNLWQYSGGGGVYSAPAIGADGTVYIDAGWITALNPLTGAKKNADSQVAGYIWNGSPTIASDGTVYVPTINGRLYAMTPNLANTRWLFENGAGSAFSAAAVGADGVLYVGCDDSRLYALDGASGTKLWEYNAGGKVSSPVLGGDGTVYASTESGKLVAVWSSSTAGLANSPWPVFQNNPRHTAQARPPTEMPPYFTREPESVLVGVGDQVTFSAAVSGVPPVSFQWLKDGEALMEGTRFVGVTTTNLTLRDIVVADAGKYALRASNAGGSAVSVPAVLKVDPIARPPVTLAWQSAVGPTFTAPAIGPDGTVYAGDMYGNLFLMDGMNGGFLATFNTGRGGNNSNLSRPAVGDDGTVYFGSLDWFVYAVDGATGVKRWEFATDDKVEGSPAIGADGTVFIGSDDMTIYALDGQTGAEKWSYQTAGKVTATPAIAASGAVIVGSADATLYALNADTGAKLWGYQAGGGFGTSAAIGADGTVYVYCYDGLLHAINGSSGTKKWGVRTDGFIRDAPVIGADGALYLGTEDGLVISLDGVTGAKRWQFKANTGALSSPVVGSDGTVFCGSPGNIPSDGVLYAIDGQTGIKRWEYPFHERTVYWCRAGAAIGTNGVIYFGPVNAKILAFQWDLSGPAESAWPMDGQNPQRTARLHYAGPTTPVITSQPQSQTVAQGATVELQAAASGLPPLTYQWRKDGNNLVDGNRLSGVTTPTLTLATVQPGDAGSYTLYVVNPAGSTLSQAAVLAVTAVDNQAPVVTLTAPPEGLTLGEPGTLTLEASATDPDANGAIVKVEFYANATKLGEDALAPYTLAATNLVAGTYVLTAKATDNLGASTVSSPVTLVVKASAPAVLTHPLSQSALLGGNVSFSATASGSTPLSYRWYRDALALANGTHIGGADTAKLTITGIQAGDVGSYFVAVTNTQGRAVSRAASLTLGDATTMLSFELGEAAGMKGAEVVVPLQVKRFSQVLSFQFSLHWDPAVVRLVGAEQFGLNGLGAGNFGTGRTNEGILTVSWDDPEASGKTLADGVSIAGLRFLLVGETGAACNLFVNGAPTLIEAVDSTLTALAVTTVPGQVRVADQVQISGAVLLYDRARALPGTTLALSGGAASATVSGAGGAYSFPVSLGKDYTVTPSKADDSPAANGVTTMDITLTRRHVLGVAALDSPYKILAADVNGSDSVTTMDITLMRRVILGSTNQFPAGLWRFVASDFVFADPQTPWDAPTSRAYSNLQADAAGQDFLAVKLGDVNNSWLTPVGLAAAKLAARRMVTPATVTPAVQFMAGNVSGATGAVVRVEISASGFHQVTSVQFTLSWDPSVARFVGTGDYGLDGLAAGSFGTTLTNVGKLMFSWDDPNALGVSANDGKVLFSASFLLVGAAGANSTLSFIDNPTLREVTVDFEAAPFQGQNGLLTIDSAAVTPPVITTSPKSQSVAVGGQVTLGVEATGSAPLSYQWYHDNQPVSGATGPVLTLLSVQAGQAGSYRAEVRNAAGSVFSDPAQITVAQAPEISLEMYAGLSIQGVAGMSYRIDYSTALAPGEWLPLTTLTLTNSPQLWIDEQAPRQVKRFYRAVQLP